ncbi:MAG: hypothetical protein IDH49_12785 [Gammaproteobacteria bacterium]|nr:hypothetical protein [Gammaproteobacteria bacterium]
MLAAVEGILGKAVGLHSASIGPTSIMRAVRRRMEECQVGDDDVYLGLLRSSPQELQALIDEVTVPETWFFRDLEPFRLLAEYVAGQSSRTGQESVFRVLSVPCSSGEEPYSIAIILTDMGVSRDRFRIDAVDISKRILDRARHAVYGRNSFRGDEGDARDRYFSQTGKGYELHHTIRDSVNFRHGNILDDGFLTGSGAYDVVFCRNLLIYFDRPTQMRAITKLHRLLVPEGMLFVGHAEGGCVDHRLFDVVKRTGTFAYRKKLISSEDCEPKPVAHFSVSAPSAKITVSKKPAAKAWRPDPSSIPERIDNKPAAFSVSDAWEALLREAQQLADQGETGIARVICEDYLRYNTCSASVHYLLGLVYEAEGKMEQSREMLQKAVYLDPGHYQALIHLALYAEQKGDMGAATAYRDRAKRVMERNVAEASRG